MDFLLRQYLEMYYPLKVKHNIKPEMSMLDSQRQAEIMFFNGNYPLETARPLNPNTIFINPVVGLPSNQVVGFQDLQKRPFSKPQIRIWIRLQAPFFRLNP